MLYLLMINKVCAQDSKAKNLFEGKDYCNCIARCEKVLSKERNTEVMYYRTASLLHLFKKNDKSCAITNPLQKSLAALSRLTKYKIDTSELDIIGLENEIISAYTDKINEEIKLRKWKQAIATLDLITAYKPLPKFYSEKAFCQYALHDQDAIYSVSDTIHFTSKNNRPDTIDVFSLVYKILKELESSNQVKEYNQLMDTMVRNFPGNEILVKDIYDKSLRKWYMYKHENRYDSLLAYSVSLRNCYPENRELQNQISTGIISIADSLAGQYIKADTSMASLLACIDLLVSTRFLLGDYVAGLKQTKYFSLVPNKAKKFTVSSLIGNDIGFRIDDNSRRYYSLGLKSVISLVPCKAIGEIPGYIWKNASRSKQAKSGRDVIKKETMNYFLLDSLTHIYCNKFRRENKLRELKWSFDYYRASKHHAFVMASRNAIWHGEDMDSTFSSLDSITMYLRRFQGENCQFIGMGRDTYTYDDYAKKIIESWKSSPGHRKNMLNNYSFESASTMIVSLDNIYGVLTNDTILSKYLPEYKKFLDIFPSFRMEWFGFAQWAARPTSFSSQNFPIIGH